MLSFLTPARYVKLWFPSQVDHIYGITTVLRDLRLENVAALLATVARNPADAQAVIDSMPPREQRRAPARNHMSPADAWTAACSYYKTAVGQYPDDRRQWFGRRHEEREENNGKSFELWNVSCSDSRTGSTLLDQYRKAGKEQQGETDSRQRETDSAVLRRARARAGGRMPQPAAATLAAPAFGIASCRSRVWQKG